MAVAVSRLPLAVGTAPVIGAVGFGVPVHCRDGRAGKVSGLVLDSEGRALTHIVVSAGRAFRRHVVVLSDRILLCSDYRLDLNMLTEELHRMPEFEELEEIVRDPSFNPRRSERGQSLWVVGDGPVVMVPGDGTGDGWVVGHRHRGVPSEAIPLRRGTVVYEDLERVGCLEHVLLDDDGRTITDLVVKPSRWGDPDIVVPMEQVQFVDENSIWLDSCGAVTGRKRWPTSISTPPTPPTSMRLPLADVTARGRYVSVRDNADVLLYSPCLWMNP